MCPVWTVVDDTELTGGTSALLNYCTSGASAVAVHKLNNWFPTRTVDSFSPSAACIVPSNIIRATSQTSRFLVNANQISSRPVTKNVESLVMKSYFQLLLSN